jgi:HTH-type transcriptional regulator/antitoxin HigA
MIKGDGKMTAIAKRINKAKYANLLGQALPVAIHNEKECDQMQAIVDKLLKKNEAQMSAEELALLELVSTLIEKYEDEHHPIEPLPPVEFLKQIMADRGLRQKDMVEVFGSQGITSEVLNGKRAISKTHAKKLAEFFKVSVEHFI